ncbi:signal recognition particle-docking protein FtsY [Candidatus Woesearchaeota archaeon]|nr:signal recognition particle-docking protein FtsY [Candidatus Woesearchaeota archaeon]
MFKFLKEKLKSAISKISESVEKEGKIEESAIEKSAEEAESKEEKGFFAKIKEKFIGKEEPREIIEEKKPAIERKRAEIKKEEKPKIIRHEKIKEERRDPRIIKEVIREHPELFGKDFPEMLQKAEPVVMDKKVEKEIDKKYQDYYDKKVKEKPKKIIEEKPDKKGFFAALTEKIITTKISEEQFEKLFWELELALMENNVAVEVIEKIKNDLKEELVEKPIKRTKVLETIQETLKNSIEDLFLTGNINLIQEIKNKKEKPYVIAFFGINGSGKTTSIAKLASMLKENDVSCVLAASDTFRAASIEQLQQHADKIGVKLVKHDYGADPAAVAFDAIKHSKAKGIDAVLIDTAGRMHSNVNLIDEMKKIIRVAKPDLKIFVGESITGNDCVEQAKTFNEAVGIDGIILAKADIDEKGGAAVSVSYVTKKPILYLGTGQKYSDLQEFDAGLIIKSLGLA